MLFEKGVKKNEYFESSEVWIVLELVQIMGWHTIEGKALFQGAIRYSQNMKRISSGPFY